MSSKRDYVAQIEEIRERTGPPDWDNGITKLFFLSNHVGDLKGDCEELGYFPVAVIAAIESYFRWEIKSLIDSGDSRYVNNIRVDDLQIKLDHDVVVALHGKRISIGELVAHSVRLSSLDAIQRTMSQLLGVRDFFALVKEARDPFERRELGDATPALIEAPRKIFSAVKRAFQLRNIICHEAHLGVGTTVTEVKQICSNCYTFAIASYYAVAHHRDPNPLLTPAEKFQAATKTINALDAAIRSVEERIKARFPSPPIQKTFIEMQDLWRKFVQREAEFYSYQTASGTNDAIQEKRMIGSAYRTRLDSLRAYADHIESHPKSA